MILLHFAEERRINIEIRDVFIDNRFIDKQQ